MEAIERQVPKERVISLRDTLAGDDGSEADFAMVEDLASSAVFSTVRTKRELASQALSEFMQSPVQIYTMTADDEVFLYLTLNGIEDGFFFVGRYPKSRPAVEPAPSRREMNALRTLSKTSE